MSRPSFGETKDRRSRLVAASYLPVHQEGNPGTESLALPDMKNLWLLLSVAAAACPLSARDLAPDYWVENVMATDDSVQQSLVFRTVPGVAYRVETTENLTSWTAGDEIYGMGHEYVVPVREFTPPPPPPGGGGGPLHTAPVRRTVSLMLKRSNAPEGGTVASWPSLGGGGGVTVLLEENLGPGWDLTPLFWVSEGDYNFFIWHPFLPAAPPTSTPSLALADQGFLSELEARLPAMNAQVAINEIHARNAPPPGPPAPGSRKFWRVHADWSVDTDGDESPDWAEFEMMADPLHPSHSLADPFESDTDGNQIKDGSQTDTDIDGTPDNIDIGVGDAAVSEVISAPPRYALFPLPVVIQNNARRAPLGINDRGTVLYPRTAWRNGELISLKASTGTLETWDALAQNDAGEIVGNGKLTIPSAVPGLADVTVLWASPEADPEAVTYTDADGKVLHGTIEGADRGGALLSNDGHVMIAGSKWYSMGAGGSLTQGELGDGPALWKLPRDGHPAARAPITPKVPGLTQILDKDTYWGYDENTLKSRWGGTTPAPPLDNRIVKVTRSLSGTLTVFYDQGPPHRRYVPPGLGWIPSAIFANATDLAADGSAIGATSAIRTAPMMTNGNWKELVAMAPQAAPPWDGDSVHLSDISPMGWALASEGEGGETRFGALLPLRLEGRLARDGQILKEAAGVDAMSIRSHRPGDAVLQRQWVMVPSGGSTPLTLRAPLNEDTELKIEGANLTFGGTAGSVTVSSDVNALSISAAATVASGSEIPLKLTLGGTESVSYPIAVKVMKPRVIKVALFKVTKVFTPPLGPLPANDPVPNPPDIVPDETALETYLNKIYQPQMNVTSDIIPVAAPVESDWDVLGRNATLDIAGPDSHSSEQETVLAAAGPGPPANIKLFLMGTSNNFGGTLHASGYANRAARTCWVVAEPLSGTTTGYLNHIIAHEIGHVIRGNGHPGEDIGPGQLPGVSANTRLMTTKPNPAELGNVLVKEEWDEAETWMKMEEAANRLGS